MTDSLNTTSTETRNFAFISRHTPTQGQIDLALDQGITLTHVGDRDAFTLDAWEFRHFDGVIVVHPAAALRASMRGLVVGVFENALRPVEGGTPSFEARSLHLFAPAFYAPAY